MIHMVEKGVAWENPNTQIIFNPVSVTKGRVGQKVFNELLKKSYINVFNSYTEYMVGESSKKLLGDIQLVQIQEDKIIMNGFIYKGDNVNLLALTKALIELYNLAEEYELNVAIPMTMNCEDINMVDSIKIIINIIFADFKYDVYLYTR